MDRVEELIIDFNNKISDLQNQIDDLNIKLSQTKSEQFYQKHLEKILDGKHQTTKHGITDIFTKDSIYEIKCWKNYKACFGQLKSYHVGNEDKRLCGVFYGDVKEEQKQNILDLFIQNQIDVYEINENSEGIITLTQLTKSKENYQNEFYNWLDKNIEYKEGSILKLKDLCELYFKNRTIIGVKEKSKFKKHIEKFIKIYYHTVNQECQRTTIYGKPFQGWFNLSIKH